METSTSSTSGSTATVAVEVWMRPWLSVAGIRCTRCTPASCLKMAYAPRPFTPAIASRSPPASASLTAISSTVSPRDSA